MSTSEKRQIENEVIFRKSNEKVVDDLNSINKHNIKEGNPDLTIEDDQIIHFICECSDENCKVRIPISLKSYQQIHKNRKAFILKNDHAVKNIEKITKTKKSHIVVEKKRSISNPGNKLNKTTVNNT